MPKVIGVKFDKSPKIYYFGTGENEYGQNAAVVVETARGTEIGTVEITAREVPEDKLVLPLKDVSRLATAEDLEKKEKLEKKRVEAMKVIRERIDKSGLAMKLVDAEYTFDGGKLVVYFTAENRVDFRNLVRELASYFHVRIELRQIGARDECRIKGGIAPCGRACCCSDHMSEFAHVTIKMAKNQSLSLNPAKISGLCGRLMCCLAYENAHYAETNKRMPKIGAEATAPDGKKGVVVSVNQLKEQVRLKIENKDAFDLIDYPLAEIKFRPKGNGSAKEKEDESASLTEKFPGEISDESSADAIKE